MDKTKVETFVLSKDESKRDVDALHVGTWFKPDSGDLCVKISDHACWNVDNGELQSVRLFHHPVTIVPYISVTASV